ncbi:MAG: hypothetical protein ACRDGT_02000 [Candidatus Limnocylindria bacterium]
MSAANSPINFRMPRPLRLRLHKFASARHLSEAEALRVVVSERLDDLETTAELAAAERWQYEQAYATWDRFRRGQGRTVPREQIQEIFARALKQGPEHAERTR